MLGTSSTIVATLRSEQFARRSRKMLVYLTGQGAVQLLNAATGLLLLRWLSVKDYAQYILAFSFSVALGLLTDLGFSGTIVALVGPRGNDPKVIGSYIRSGRHLRNLLLLICSPVAAILFIRICRQHQWDILTSTVLYISIVVSIYFNGTVSYFGAPLLIRGQLTQYYRSQIGAAIFRIATCGLLFMTGWLSAWTASWINVLAFFLTGLLYVRASRPFVQIPHTLQRSATHQMWHYILPNLPSLIFFSLQGQISLFLISLFGGTRSIAEVGALGRLAQLFLLFSGFNGTVIEPFIARLPDKQVLRYFLLIAACGTALAGSISLLGFYFPGLLLPLLGPRYASLHEDIGWVVLSSCIGYLVGVLWTMTAARRWIYWETTWVTIGCILLTQVTFAWRVGVTSTFHAVLFGVVTSGAYLLSTTLNCIYGYFRGPRIAISTPVAPESLSEILASSDQL